MVYFQLFKHYYAKAIDVVVQSKDAKFFKVKFLARITTIQKQKFKKNTILLPFRKTGLIPYNFSMILNKIQEVEKDFRATPKRLPLSNLSTSKRLFKKVFLQYPLSLNS